MGTKRVGLARVEALIENLKRNLNLSGSTLVGQKQSVETLSADGDALTAADSGKLFLLDAADETASTDFTLPQLDTDHIGVTYKFAVTDPTDGAFTITTGDTTDTSGDMFIGGVVMAAGQVSSTSNGANGRSVVPGADDNTITLDGNLANGGGELGTVITCTAVSATQWLVDGIVVTDDANSTGAAIFTDTDQEGKLNGY